MKKTYLYTGLGVLTLVGALSIAGLTGNAGYFKKSEAVQDALRSGDIEAFQAAVTQEGNSRLAARVENIDEEKFAQLQQKFLSHEAVKEAIAEGDWEAYQEAVAALENNDGETRMGRKHGHKMIAETEEEFNELVEKYNENIAVQEDLLEAVTNDDRAAFDTIILEQIEERRADIDSEKLARIEERFPEITDEMLDTLWENAQLAVENGDEINLRTLKGGRGHRMSLSRLRGV